MSCTATITRLTTTSALIVLTPPTGFTISTVNAPTTINCSAVVNMDKSVRLTITRDRAYVSFSATAITITGAIGTFKVDVVNATAVSPLQVPLACNFCVPPMTGETYMRLTRGRVTATGPGFNPDVRIAARRTWGDDFVGCNTCNRTASAAISGISTGIIYGGVTID